MKIFIYGMQSSGASLITYFMAQKANTIAVIDLWNECEAPAFNEEGDLDIILKCVITAKISLKTHLSNFKPDKKILVLRHPIYNYASLKNKDHATQGGSLDEKFQILDVVLEDKDQFDLVIMYEDFLFNPNKILRELQKIGYEASKDFYEFNRSREEILNFNYQHNSWCKASYGKQWGFGYIQFGEKQAKVLLTKAIKSLSTENKKKVQRLCPCQIEYYKKNFHYTAKYILTVSVLFAARMLRAFCYPFKSLQIL